VIGDAVVFAGTDVTTGSTGVFALDAATGAMRWQVELDASLSVGLGTAAAHDTVYVTWWEAPTGTSVGVPALTAFALADGKQRWAYRAAVTQEELAAATGATITAPAIAGGSVLFGVAVQAPPDTPATEASGIYAIDADTGKPVWQVSGLQVASAPVVVNETVYIMGGGSTGEGRGSSVIALRPG
ncbi:MAG: PQQ-binding-like beta-propeller repeat protein, partial [Thermomicrobiales bacterium]|nr:PQQ-binding-like beta-propeller repeat protein [Thermomicrobiales bacterium]